MHEYNILRAFFLSRKQALFDPAWKIAPKTTWPTKNYGIFTGLLYDNGG